MAVVEPDYDGGTGTGGETPLSSPGSRSEPLASLLPPTERDHRAARETQRRGLAQLLLADLLALVSVAFLVPVVLEWITGRTPSAHDYRVGLSFSLGMCLVFLAVFAAYGLYRGVGRRITYSVFADLPRLGHAVLVGGMLYAVAGYLALKSGLTDQVSVGKIAVDCLLVLLLVPLARGVSWALYGRAWSGSVPIIVVGTGQLAQTVASHLRAHGNVEFVGFVDDDPLQQGAVLGQLSELPELCHRYDVARVVVCFSRTHPEQTIEMLKALAGQVPVSIVPRYYELVTSRTHVEDLSGLPVLDVAPASMSMGSPVVKRAFDLVVSALALVFLAPLFVVTAIIIRATSPGPVFFRQERAGKDGREFHLLKFRTMVEDAEEMRSSLQDLNEVDGPLFKVTNDPRVTGIGRILRKTSLDELPQLVNVFKGQMSLVGPRPFVVSEAAAIEGWARRRFETRPGMTGLWQVSGRNELSYLELCRLDYQYVASWSFWWDIQILWKTPATIFKGRGAS